MNQVTGRERTQQNNKNWLNLYIHSSKRCCFQAIPRTTAATVTETESGFANPSDMHKRETFDSQNATLPPMSVRFGFLDLVARKTYTPNQCGWWWWLSHCNWERRKPNFPCKRSNATIKPSQSEYHPIRFVWQPEGRFSISPSVGLHFSSVNAASQRRQHMGDEYCVSGKIKWKTEKIPTTNLFQHFDVGGSAGWHPRFVRRCCWPGFPGKFRPIRSMTGSGNRVGRVDYHGCCCYCRYGLPWRIPKSAGDRKLNYLQ